MSRTEPHRGEAAVVHPLLAYAFRPFFLLAAGYAVIAMGGWLGLLFIGWPVAQGISPLRWHAHEILFGVIPAAIAGFVLTAMCNWTGAKPLQGRGLAALVALWLGARVAMWLPATLPAALIVALDVGFLLVLAGYVGMVIIAADSRRNLGIVAMIGVLILASSLSHAGMWQHDTAVATAGEHLAVYFILLLIAVIGGRITPAFSGNWLVLEGRSRTLVRGHRALDALAIGSLVALVLLDLSHAPAWLVSATALLATLANAARLLGWAGWHCRRNPLLWVLHLGYAWLVVALLLKGLAPWLAPVTDVVWLHAAGVGAMGTMIVGVMTRVALGHTGRPLVLPTGAVLIYWSITLAAVLRVASALEWVDYRWALLVSGLAWMIAFALYVALYWPILSTPRPDGRPG